MNQNGFTTTLCYFRITPYRAVAQYVNDTPYTMPAKRILKIGSRAYRGHVIFSRPLLKSL